VLNPLETTQTRGRSGRLGQFGHAPKNPAQARQQLSKAVKWSFDDHRFALKLPCVGVADLTADLGPPAVLYFDPNGTLVARQWHLDKKAHGWIWRSSRPRHLDA
jgi:hypothetical protein